MKKYDIVYCTFTREAVRIVDISGFKIYCEHAWSNYYYNTHMVSMVLRDYYIARSNPMVILFHFNLRMNIDPSEDKPIVNNFHSRRRL